MAWSMQTLLLLVVLPQYNDAGMLMYGNKRKYLKSDPQMVGFYLEKDLRPNMRSSEDHFFRLFVNN